MDFENVKKLADLMDERGLSSIEVCEGEMKISLSRAAAVPAQLPQPAAAPAPPAPGEAGETPAVPAQQARPQEEGEALTSPLVGIAYLQPEPGAKAFTAVGEKVKKGQTLCIVEAMKVMNEFTAPRDGEVLQVCVQDGEMVEFGQALFRLK